MRIFEDVPKLLEPNEGRQQWENRRESLVKLSMAAVLKWTISSAGICVPGKLFWMEKQTD